MLLTDMMINVGWTHDSKTPSKNRTTIKAGKFFAAAEQEMTTPQQNTLCSKLSDKTSYQYSHLGWAILSGQIFANGKLL